jgi:hypothetical protein
MYYGAAGPPSNRRATFVRRELLAVNEASPVGKLSGEFVAGRSLSREVNHVDLIVLAGFHVGSADGNQLRVGKRQHAVEESCSFQIPDDLPRLAVLGELLK